MVMMIGVVNLTTIWCPYYLCCCCCGVSFVIIIIVAMTFLSTYGYCHDDLLPTIYAYFSYSPPTTTIPPSFISTFSLFIIAIFITSSSISIKSHHPNHPNHYEQSFLVCQVEVIIDMFYALVLWMVAFITLVLIVC